MENVAFYNNIFSFQRTIIVQKGRIF